MEDAQEDPKPRSGPAAPPGKATPKTLSKPLVTAALEQFTQQDLLLLAEPLRIAFYNNWRGQGDVALVKLLTRIFMGSWLYDHSEKRWHLWDGRYWCRDRTGRVLNLAADTLTRMLLHWANTARTEDEQRVADRALTRVSRVDRITAIVRHAQSQPGMYLREEESWGAPEHLLPVANGLVNLKTGRLQQTHPRMRIRDFAPTEWIDLEASAPLWQQTIMDLCCGDGELALYLRSWMGYCLTGETREQKFALFHGSGGNGKSIVVDVLARILGPTVVLLTSADMLMQQRLVDPEGPKPLLASLRGKRLHCASESENGQTLNAGLIKALTGDGLLTARTLNEENRSFPRTHKTILITNHLPRLPDSGDAAFWRRCVVIPFKAVFSEQPKENELPVDKNLMVKLLAEAPGILAWFVRGAKGWYRDGLPRSEAVVDATDRYHHTEDPYRLFVASEIARDVLGCITPEDLWSWFQAWCFVRQLDPGAPRPFHLRMTKELGATAVRSRDGRSIRCHIGFGLKNRLNG